MHKVHDKGIFYQELNGSLADILDRSIYYGGYEKPITRKIKELKKDDSLDANNKRN